MMVIIGFVIWSLVDTVCKPCTAPSGVCTLMCTPEPRWHNSLTYEPLHCWELELARFFGMIESTRGCI